MLTSKCQLDCSYCCSRRSLTYHDTLRDSNGNLSQLNKEQIDIIFDAISKANYDITLNLLGGEPTLHPLVNYVIDKSLNYDNIKIIELSTNGMTNLEKIHRNKKLRVIFTYHPSEVKNDLKFLNNVKLFKGADYDINIMLPRDLKFKEQVDKFIFKLKLYNIKNIIPVYPYTDNFDINEEYTDIEKDAKYYIYNDKKYSLFDVYKLGLNKFKGWHCKNMSYIININGNIQQCSSKILGNIYKNQDFFIDINPHQICEYDSCNYEGFMRSLKNTEN